MAASAAAVRPDFLARLSDGLWRRPGLFVLLLLTPPLLWLGIIYVAGRSYAEDQPRHGSLSLDRHSRRSSWWLERGRNKKPCCGD